MEDMKLRFEKAIAERLTAAPDGDAKSDLLEELADNLFQRYQELIAAGEGPETAFAQAMEDLGDSGELVDYLRSQWGETGGLPALGDTPDAGKTVPEGGDQGKIQGMTLPGQGLRNLDVELPDADISVAFDGGEDAVISGDLENLTVDVAEDGTLSVRARHQPSDWNFTSRKMDVKFRLPRRDWGSIRVASANGKTELKGDVRGENVSVTIANGEIDGQLAVAGLLKAEAANGDIHWRGDGEKVRLCTAAGDICFKGAAREFSTTSASGDVEFTGEAEKLRCSSASGDVRLEISRAPRDMAVTAQSGDCAIRLPEDPQGFSVRLTIVSGDMDSEFPLRKGGRETWAFCGSGGPEYTVTTVSGDIELKKY